MYKKTRYNDVADDGYNDITVVLMCYQRRMNENRLWIRYVQGSPPVDIILPVVSNNVLFYENGI